MLEHSGETLDPTFDSALETDFDDSDAVPKILELTLRVRDPELVAELGAFGSRRERDEFALAALRVGVVALRAARGNVDAHAVRGEVERMLAELRRGLDQHRGTLQLEVEKTLREYFDPRSGRFAERVEALTCEDGELARVIRSHVEGSDSALVRTLAQHVGEESPLLRILDPASSEGLAAALSRHLEDALGAQREQILAEFSLDNREGSLARLVGELKLGHGQLGEALQGQIEGVVREFSLDREDSALSRLVARVERAQQRITEEFTLDSETSALARLRRELGEHAARQTEVMTELEKRVATELAKLNTRREADARAPAHGDAFEDALLSWLESAARSTGDLFEATGTTAGSVSRCKVGDALITLGPEQRAAGARIVIEAKEEAGFLPVHAREELERARKNRGAEFGIFVLSRKVATDRWKPLDRVGNDVFVVWDADDPAADFSLEMALSVARALCTRSREHGPSSLDLPDFERAVREVEKQAAALEELRKLADGIESNTDKIRERVRVMRGHLTRSVESLDRASEALRRELGTESPGS